MYRIRVDGRKRRFSNTMTSCLGSRLAFPHIRFENVTCGRRFFKYGEKNLRFRKYPATCGWSNTIQKRYVWTQIFFLNTEEKVSVFENTRLRVDGQIRFKNATCGRRFFFKYGGKSLRFRKYPATCGWSNTIQKRYVWTQIFFLNTEEKVSVFENTRLRVDEALMPFT